MSPSYYYPFLDPPAQGDLHSTRLPGFDLTDLGINLRRYRQLLRRGPIGSTGRLNLNHARLHLACTF
eukprot:4085610-Pleurochrysis_carterae.AAC.1